MTKPKDIRKRQKRKIKRQLEAQDRERREAEFFANDQLRALFEAKEKELEEARENDERERIRVSKEWEEKDLIYHEGYLKRKMIQDREDKERREKEEQERMQREEAETEEFFRIEKLKQEAAEKRALVAAEMAARAALSKTPRREGGTEKDQICPYYSKTGACRFGDYCLHRHLVPDVSNVIVFRNFFLGTGLAVVAGEDLDAELEMDEEELLREFAEFYEDVEPECRSLGTVQQFKVCRNGANHLRGNVYVQYRHIETAIKAQRLFSERFFGGRIVVADFVPIKSWRSAICGLGAEKCPRGRDCNFLHVFANPDNAYADADIDLYSFPPEDTPVTERKDHTERRSERHERLNSNDRSRGRSRSPSHRDRRKSVDRDYDRSDRRWDERREYDRDRDQRRSSPWRYERSDKRRYERDYDRDRDDRYRRDDRRRRNS